MANLSKTRTIFAFTSPRTIEKIIPEIKVLISNFKGQVWDSDTQELFFEELFNSDFYEGNKRPKDAAFAARDRITRAPKALGYVDLKPHIALTNAGRLLLSGKRTNEAIARQIFKFQLPSPYHNVPSDREFDIRPYLELLRLVNVLGNISKMEIAIFFVQMTNYELFDEIVDRIVKFREAVSKNKGNRKKFIDDIFNKEITKIYEEDIRINDLKTRESGDKDISKFIKTKKSNQIDYADALMRYIRATQYVTFDKKTFRMIIAPARKDEVNYVLETVDRAAFTFSDERTFKDYLFDPYVVSLLTDSPDYLKNKLDKLAVDYSSIEDVEALKDLLKDAEQQIITAAIAETQISLKEYKEYDDIVDIFQKIQKKDIPDPPLYLEWNIWRSMVMMNYAKSVQGNFSLDLDGLPLNTALGNMPDIEIEYGDFKMIVEVTMSSGNKQYEMEGEPVARHFGKIQRTTDKPVYCLFVAPKISEGALAHFFNLNRMNTRAYGGKTRIVPMSLNQFLMFISVAKDKGFSNSKMLQNYLDKIIQINQNVDDENLWYESIGNSILTWIS